MRKIIDLSGKHFGSLTVLSYDKRKTVSNAAQWKCECECGRKLIVRGDNLRDGRTSRCSVCHRGGVPSVFIFDDEGAEENGAV